MSMFAIRVEFFDLAFLLLVLLLCLSSDNVQHDLQFTHKHSPHKKTTEIYLCIFYNKTWRGDGVWTRRRDVEGMVMGYVIRKVEQGQLG